MSNPPVPVALRRLRGNPSHRRLPREVEPAVAPECPSPPSFLDGFARDEWWRVAPELHRLRLLTILDVGCLASYCVSYSRWRTAEEALARMAERDEDARGLMIRSADGGRKANPLVRIASQAADDMIAVAGLFGMTPVARSRLAAGIYGQPPGPSKFDGLLG